jgi:ribosome-associated translation inhibitor RaiA
MKVILHSSQIDLPETEKNYLKSKVLFRFSRFQDQIKNISVFLSDINGPKGGFDKHCVIKLEVPKLKEIVVTSEWESLVSVVDHSALRAKSAFLRVQRKKLDNFNKKVIIII